MFELSFSFSVFRILRLKETVASLAVKRSRETAVLNKEDNGGRERFGDSSEKGLIMDSQAIQPIQTTRCREPDVFEEIGD